MVNDYVFEFTLDELVEKVCKLYLHDWWEGEATGGAAATIVDADSRFEADDYFNSLPYCEVYIRSTTDGAAPIGDTRIIIDWVNSTTTMTADSNFTATPADGDTYSIHSEFKRTWVVAAINQAIERAARRALRFKEDETTRLVSAVYTYPIPSGFTHITSLIMEDGDGHFKNPPIPSTQYRVMPGAVPKIVFTRSASHLEIEDVDFAQDIFSPTGGRMLRIEGLGRPEKLVNDTDTCTVNPEYICAQAAATLFFSRIGDKPKYGGQAGVWQTIADREYENIEPTPLPFRTKRVLL